MDTRSKGCANVARGISARASWDSLEDLQHLSEPCRTQAMDAYTVDEASLVSTKQTSSSIGLVPTIGSS